MGVQVLRARWVLPVVGEPIECGEVAIENGRIVEVRRAAATGSRAGDVRDLGEAVLMPGLVNAHAHVEYTVMRGVLEDMAFFPWVRALTAMKAALGQDDWVASATVGALEGLAGGVTAIGDCTDSGAAMDGCTAAGLRGTIYQEVFGIDEDRPVDDALTDLDGRLAALRARSRGSRLGVGVSPHAPYTVRTALFRALSTYAAAHELPVCIHASESQAEAEWVRFGTGPIGEMCARRGIAWEPSRATSVAYLDSVGALGSRTLLVHGVQLALADCALGRARGVAWAHCPKSNAKLANGAAELSLLNACSGPGGPRVGLGSDSVASNNTMDLFEEMRFAVLAQRAQERRVEAMTARDAVHLATLGGASALGLADSIGSLEQGKQADIIAVSVDGLHTMPCHDPYSAIVYAAGARDVRLTMIGGGVLYEDGLYTMLDPRPAAARLREAAVRMRAWQVGQAGGGAA